MDVLSSALREHFGFSDFRPAQRPVIEAILASRPAVAVMPTGAGKSLCFQLPAVLLDGITLVVSPLISLMKDQVDALTSRGIRANAVNSTQSPSEQREVLEAAVRGELDLLYVAPERFRFEGAMAQLRRLSLALFVVDEAHCISKWGHDFRPDYQALGTVIRDLKAPRVAAFTATATAAVREDITRSLGMTDPMVLVNGFMRDNLHLGVMPVRRMAEKREHMATMLRGLEGSAVVYCATRRHCEEVAHGLRGHGLDAEAYHAGLEDTLRDAVQERFLRGATPVIVATNAFGMGIDKPDIRVVIHYDLPGSVEAYYQEVGRAGRDGQTSRCVLLFTYADTRIHEFFISRAGEGLPTEQQAKVVARERDKLRSMVDYAYETSCRHGAILRYFGEPFSPEADGCGACDICTGQSGVGALATREVTRTSKGSRRSASRARTTHVSRPLEEHEHLVVQKVLSAVARSNGRLGVAALARILRGSQRGEIASDPLASTRSYGILKGVSHPTLTSLLGALHAAGCTRGQRPRLTPLGTEVMWRRAEVQLGMPPFKERTSASRDPHLIVDLTGQQRACLEALKAARKVAAEERGLPAFRIATNRVLEGLCLLEAGAERSDWMQVRGVGELNVDPLRDLFLDVLATQ